MTKFVRICEKCGAQNSIYAPKCVMCERNNDYTREELKKVIAQALDGWTIEDNTIAMAERFTEEMTSAVWNWMRD